MGIILTLALSPTFWTGTELIPLRVLQDPQGPGRVPHTGLPETSLRPALHQVPRREPSTAWLPQLPAPLLLWHLLPPGLLLPATWLGEALGLGDEGRALLCWHSHQAVAGLPRSRAPPGQITG